MANQGTFIVIEGADGSGKKTQFQLLRERLRAVGYDVETFDYPQYDKDSSYFVKQYLAGVYGPAARVSPYTASLFYALDRFESSPRIKGALDSGKIVLSNRFVGANMAHQGSKITDPLEQRSFFVWEDSLEFQLLGIPRPTINIFLRVPAETSVKLIQQRANRTGKKLDEHEKDIEHLRHSVATYDMLCKLFPTDFVAVECTENGQLLSIPEISDRIWSVVKPLLPSQPPKKARSVTFRLDEDGSLDSTPAKEQPTARGDFLDYQVKELSLATLLDISMVLPGAVTGELSWEKAGYKYYIPPNLSKKTLAKYRANVEELIELQKTMRAKLKKTNGSAGIVQATTPMFALFGVHLELNQPVARRIIAVLSQANTPEAVGLAEELAKAAHKLWPRNFDGQVAASTSAPEPLGDIIARLAKEELPQNLSADTESVKLLEAWPRNEFKSLADSLYVVSNLPRDKIDSEVDRWSYQQKYDALSKAAKSPESPLKHIRYHFDIVADRLSLAQLQGQEPPEELHIQPATPRYGYEVPAILSKHEIEDEFISCFDKSLEIFSTLQAASRDEIASYAVLLGNKSRAGLTISAQWLINQPWRELSGRQRHLMLQLAERIAEVHPAVGSVILETVKTAQKEAPKASAKPKTSSRRHHRGGKPKKS